MLIRARAAGQAVEFTVMTGATDPAYLERVAALGADGLMTKPLRVEDVLSRLAADGSVPASLAAPAALAAA